MSCIHMHFKVSFILKLLFTFCILHETSSYLSCCQTLVKGEIVHHVSLSYGRLNFFQIKKCLTIRALKCFWSVTSFWILMHNMHFIITVWIRDRTIQNAYKYPTSSSTCCVAFFTVHNQWFHPKAPSEAFLNQLLQNL